MQISVRQFVICASIWAGCVWNVPSVGAPAVEPEKAKAGAQEILLLKDVLSEVLIRNPALKAAQANWSAMKQRVPQARAWDDLRGEFDTVAGRFVSLPPNAMPDQRLMLEQAVPL